MTFLELVGAITLFSIGIGAVLAAARFLFGSEHAEGE